MKGLKKKRRIQIIVLAFAALALSTGLIGYAMRTGSTFSARPPRWPRPRRSRPRRSASAGLSSKARSCAGRARR